MGKETDAGRTVDANPQMKIDTGITPKLAQCDPQMLDMVENFLDRLFQYRDMLSRRYRDT